MVRTPRKAVSAAIVRLSVPLKGFGCGAAALEWMLM
jgi:hypothetical protein